MCSVSMYVALHKPSVFALCHQKLGSYIFAFLKPECKLYFKVVIPNAVYQLQGTTQINLTFVP